MLGKVAVDLGRKAPGFIAEAEKVPGGEGEAVEGAFALGRHQNAAPLALFLQEMPDRRPAVELHRGPVIEPGPAQGLLGQGEGRFAHDVQGKGEGRAKAGEIPGVLRDLRGEKGDFETVGAHGGLLNPRVARPIFPVPGDVAQLGERRVRNAEVVGSTPIVSTPRPRHPAGPFFMV